MPHHQPPITRSQGGEETGGIQEDFQSSKLVMEERG